MAENVYEGMFIFDSNRYAREPSAVPGEIDQLIEAAGGEMLASRLWEERRLAYPIKRQRKGTYWLTYFRLATDKLTEINRKVEINDNVLRHLILKIDPRLVDAMVSHATGATKEEPAAEDGKTEVAAVAAVAATDTAVAVETPAVEPEVETGETTTEEA